MPIHAKGRFPKPSTTFRDDGTGGTRSTIEEYRALKEMSQAHEALKLLQSVGAVVKPIMIKHHWRLSLLVEIYPKQQSLLGFNVNRGQKIALRLRHASSQHDFLDQESIIETMLHELAHNLRGPHDDVFFQHLDTLTQEWYELQRNSSHSLPGLGFLTKGARLGGEDTNLVTPTMARQKAADMAERRRRLAELMEDGAGRRLGGAAPSSSSSLLMARAEAAERRRNITQNCPSSSVQDTQIAAQEQEEQELLHGIQVITIDDDGEDDLPEHLPTTTTIPKEETISSDDDDDLIIVDVKKVPPKQLRPQRKDTPSPNLVTQTRAAAALRHNLLLEENTVEAFQHGIEQPASSSSITTQSQAWNCQQCTLLNSPVSLTCQACDEIRPGLEYWICSYCHHQMLGDYAHYWCCSKCSNIKKA